MGPAAPGSSGPTWPETRSASGCSWPSTTCSSVGRSPTSSTPGPPTRNCGSAGPFRPLELGNFALELGLTDGSLPLLIPESTFGWISALAQWTDATPNGQLVRSAARRLSNKLLPKVSVDRRSVLFPGVLAQPPTGREGPRPEGGWGWVTAQTDGSAHGVRAGDITTLELEAIAQLLEAMPPEQELEVLIDSRFAGADREDAPLPTERMDARPRDRSSMRRS